MVYGIDIQNINSYYVYKVIKKSKKQIMIVNCACVF